MKKMNVSLNRGRITDISIYSNDNFFENNFFLSFLLYDNFIQSDQEENKSKVLPHLLFY
jgi:hypothetical protein